MNESIKMVITSLAPLLIVLLLFAVVGKFGISKVTDLRTQLNSLQKDQTVLSQKLNILQSLSQTLSQGSGFAMSAFPEDNPALTVISQLKRIAPTGGVSLTNIKAGAEVKDKSGLSRVDVSFEATGPRSSVLAFIKDIQTLAPITLVDKVKITELGGIAKADVSVKSFWSALPTSIPSVAQPITDLTSQEKSVLGTVSSLLQPSLTNVSPVSGGKSDPFSP